ncbi:Conserved_hypothetical protein [Hexamita inflata]|uniref:Uncharacterized protein n=1 Tax=Hexamita inflata TaxID=28002 RepID=A0AA86NE68_9EUKA|nr:Conserved hypothetical protein [Hexamita inflata]
MIYIQAVYALLCFQTNTTVVLDVQTRQLVFKAWPRDDDSRELSVCRQLNGDMFKLSVQTGTYTYELSSLQTYDVAKQIEISIPCAAGTCDDAFKAKSAIYTMEFQEAKQTITEAASNLRRLDFNRKACVDNPALQFGQNIQIAPGLFSNVFKITGIPKNCKYPLDTLATLVANNPLDKKATVNFFAYPNFAMESAQYSVTLAQLFTKGTYPCVMMPSPEVTAWCNNMVNTLATSSFGYNQMQYFVPGKIPSRDGTLTRVSNYSVIFQSNQVKNTLQATFDCYSGQSLTIYGSTLLLANQMNPAMVSCKNDMHTFVGAAYDEMITRVIFQQYEDFRAGQVYTVDFRSESQTLNSSSEWLDCKYSLDEEYCRDVLGKGQELQHYYLNVQQLIYKDGKITKIFPLSPTLSLSCVQSASAQIMDSQACVSLASICDSTSKSNQQLTLSFGDSGLYSSNLLNITAQAEYPNADGLYCFNHGFSRAQITKFTDEISGSVTGVLQIGVSKVPVQTVTDASQVQPVKNIQWFVLGTAVFAAALVGVSAWKSWV